MFAEHNSYLMLLNVCWTQQLHHKVAEMWDVITFGLTLTKATYVFTQNFSFFVETG